MAADGLAAILLPLRHPDPAVVAQRFGHQRQLALLLAADGNASGMDLRVAGIGEERPFLAGAPGRRDIAAPGVGRKEENVAVTAGGQHDGIARVRGNFAGDEIADDDSPGRAVHDHQVEHFGAGKHADIAQADLAAQGLVGAEQKLLAGLAARVKRARHLRAAERTVGQRAAILAGERHALRHALVNDVGAHLREPIDIRLPRPEITALDRVVKQAENGVAVVLVILCRVDAALRRDGVRPSRAVLETKCLHLVAKLGQRRRGRRPGQPRADDNDLELPLVRRVDQLHVETMFVPLLRQRAGWNFGVEAHVTLRPPVPQPPVAGWLCLRRNFCPGRPARPRGWKRSRGKSISPSIAPGTSAGTAQSPS